MAKSNKERAVNTEQTPPQPETPKKNKIFLYIGIGLIVLLVIGGAVAFLYSKVLLN